MLGKLARCHLALGNQLEYDDVCRSIVEHFPKSDERSTADWGHLGQALYRANRFDKNRGFAYGMKGKFDKAIADLTEVIRLNPESAEAYYTRDLAYARDKSEYEKAIADFTEAIRLNLEFVGVYYTRGLAYNRINEPDKAEADFAKARELDSDPE